jgi:arylsulfatase A-like enzyme
MNMNKRTLVLLVAVMAACVTVCFGKVGTKPNIIYILADDLGYADFGFNGQKIMKTPRIDQMRREGMNFTQHYSGSTVCAPTRSVLMTGQHTGHTTMRGNGGPGLSIEDVTVAMLMKRAGYATGAMGKWGIGEDGSDGMPHKKGFDLFFGFLNQGKAHHYYPEYLYRNDQKEMYPDNPVKRTHYAHDLFTDEALKFIKQNKDRPFFLYRPYPLSHVDLDVPDDSIAPYLGKIGPETPYKNPADGKVPTKGYIPCATPHATFAGMTSRLDRDVGRILDLLKQLKIADNTLVIFTSDNGPTSAGGADPDFFNGNGDFRGIKRDLYEGGIRMPFVAWWPGTIKANSTCDHISAFWDFLPTCAELAGVKAPKNIDGLSYLPSLLGQPKKQKQHDYLYWEFYEKGGKMAIRQGKWKAVRLNVSKDRHGTLELYDLDKDPCETNDLASKNSEKVKELAKLMESARTDSPHYSFEKKKGGKKKGRKKKK